MNTKQVIIVRKFPNLRTGKYCAQVAHASMAFLTKDACVRFFDGVIKGKDHCYIESYLIPSRHMETIKHWLKNSFKKVVCYVNSEEELLDLFEKAKAKGMLAHLVEDNGATEFKGVKTITALAIGPDVEENFEGLTNYLPLL